MCVCVCVFVFVYATTYNRFSSTHSLGQLNQLSFMKKSLIRHVPSSVWEPVRVPLNVQPLNETSGKDP